MTPTVNLASGATMPLVAYGMGTKWYGAEGERAEQLKKCITAALDSGFTHLDNAEMYKNEAHVGEALSQWLSNNPNVKRSDLFITSKFSGGAGKTPQALRAAFEKTLKELKVDYLDLYLIHSPFHWEVSLPALWEEMEKLVEEKLVRDIGVSNFRVEDLEQIAEAKVPVSVNQVEFNAYLQQRHLLEYQQKKNIILMSYHGLGPIITYKGGPLDKVLPDLTYRYATNAGLILQHWILAYKAGVVTTTENTERMKEFLSSLDTLKIDPKDIQQITDLGAHENKRKFWQKEFENEKQ